MEFTTRAAGKYTLMFDLFNYGFSVHFFLREGFGNIWGLYKDWYDGPLYELGLGKYLSITWGYNPKKR